MLGDFQWRVIIITAKAFCTLVPDIGECPGNEMSTTSKLLVERYLQGRDILSKRPDHRSQEDLAFLKEWLQDNFSIFRLIDKGDS